MTARRATARGRSGTSREPGERGSASYRRIYAVVRRVPRGRVTTYGEVATLAGLPGQARQVGYALHALGLAKAGADGVPWQRVVNARGEISLRGDPGAGELQRRVLESEGVAFDGRGRIDLARHRWKPRSRR